MSLMGWAAILAGVLILGLGVSLKIQSARLESCKEEHAVFVAQVKAAGEEQERKAKAQAAADQKRKETADRENETSRTRIATLSRQLRDERAGRSYLPPAPAGSRNPSVACYGRGSLDEKIQRTDAGITDILTILGADAVGLNTAKAWAQ